MKKLILLLGLFISLKATSLTPSSKVLCEGFLPENDMRIPVFLTQKNQGITEQEFHAVLDGIAKVYEPVITVRGARFEIKRYWADDTVNASAMQFGNRYIINMYGGLARHKAITKDGFAMVACHEVGHHLGGAPKTDNWFNDWASNEGQSDYFATLKCLRIFFNDKDNEEYVDSHDIDPLVEQNCQDEFSSLTERNACMRSAMAGLSLASLFKDLKKDNHELRFETPDPNVVSRTNDRHPDPQCRLDTYFQGSLCYKDFYDPLDDRNPNQGTCNRNQNDRAGLRPLCWYKP